jgi:hypothetical protein
MQINGRNWGMKSSMSNSLRTTIALIRKVAEDCHTFGGSTEQPIVALHHLAARTIQIPDHLKISQRREKLMRLATEVTALESHLRHVHPVCYGAAVLFSDGTVAFASQKVVLEYSCTLDAVGQLANAIDRKAIHIKDHSEPCCSVMLVQCATDAQAAAVAEASKGMVVNAGVPYLAKKLRYRCPRCRRRQHANKQGGRPTVLRQGHLYRHCFHRVSK